MNLYRHIAHSYALFRSYPPAVPLSVLSVLLSGIATLSEGVGIVFILPFLQKLGEVRVVHTGITPLDELQDLPLNLLGNGIDWLSPPVAVG